MLCLGVEVYVPHNTFLLSDLDIRDVCMGVWICVAWFHLRTQEKPSQISPQRLSTVFYDIIIARLTENVIRDFGHFTFRTKEGRVMNSIVKKIYFIVTIQTKNRHFLDWKVPVFWCFSEYSWNICYIVSEYLILRRKYCFVRHLYAVKKKIEVIG